MHVLYMLHSCCTTFAHAVLHAASLSWDRLPCVHSSQEIQKVVMACSHLMRVKNLVREQTEFASIHAVTPALKVYASHQFQLRLAVSPLPPPPFPGLGRVQNMSLV